MRRHLVPLAFVLLCLAALPASAAAQADLSIAVTDSPDPVQPDGNITYTVTVSNNGPATATSVTLSSFGANNLRFQSASVPAGWNCTLPASGTQTTSLSCTSASLTAGSSAALTFVMQADDAILGNQDGTIQFGFTVTSAISDPSNANNTETESTAYTTPDADLSVTVTDSPDPVAPDQNLTYTATVANAGPDTAGATLTVTNSGTLRFQSASVPAGWNCSLPAVGDAASFTCTNPSVNSGASAVLTFVVRPTTASAGANDTTLSTDFSVSSGVADPNAANNSETESTAYVTPDANLAVTASGPATAPAGGPVSYSVGVSNGGPDAAQNLTLTVTLPPALRFASITAPAGWSCTTPAVGATGTITCTLTTLASGGTGAFTISTTIDPAATGNSSFATNFAIGSATNDPVIQNNNASVVTTVQITNANLSVTLAESADPVTRGDTLTYTATVTNGGPALATGSTLTNVLPAGLTLVSAVPTQGSCSGTTTITCTLGSLAMNATATVVITVAVGDGAPDQITNSVSVDSSRPDPSALNNSASVTTAARNPADLRLTTAAPATAVAGDPITYTVTVVNEGGAPATGVELTLPLPPGTTFASLKQTAGPEATCTTPAAGQHGSVTCTIAELGAGASQAFELAVRSASAGEVKGTFSVASASADGEAGDQEATVTTAVAARPAPPTPPIVEPKPQPADPCTSRRRFTLRLMRRDLPGLRVNLKGARVRSAVVRTRSGRTVRTLRFSARRVQVDLRRLKPARYVVRLRIRLRTGRTVTATARYRTCRAPV